MGVPGFVLYLIKKHKNKKFFFNKNEDMNNVDALFIDTNCLLHPQCFKILAENPNIKNYRELERKMIEECINYLKYLINFSNPSKLIYIAIDGVAPIAKIKQQRQRRFKSVKTRNLFNSIKKKYNKKIDTQWNNSAITPGTEFMKKITKRIIEFCEENKDENRKIIFSTANTPAEGEHKLLQYIRNNPQNENYKYVIYGLDADLIFLALAANVNNIYLLRETQETNRKKNKEVLNYFDIDTLKSCIINDLNDLLYDEYIERELDSKKIIRDFIFICYFLGNDFLPHIPSIDIKCYDDKCINGLDLLLQAYAHVFDNTEEYLIIIDDETNKISYNITFLQLFMEYLATFEDEFFINMYNSKPRYKNLSGLEPYEKEMEKIDNLLFKIKNNIELGKDNPEDWKFRFYKQYYNIEIKQKNTIRDACFKYYEGLVWVAEYYFNKCPSWEWYYPFDHAPFISDLSDNFKRFNFDEVKFDIGKPLKPIEQLLSVLPPQSSYLIPKSYTWLMKSMKSPIIHLYPIDFELDMLYKNKYWQCIPYLPDLDIEGVKKSVKLIKESKEDKDRNKIIKELVY